MLSKTEIKKIRNQYRLTHAICGKIERLAKRETPFNQSNIDLAHMVKLMNKAKADILDEILQVKCQEVDYLQQ